VQSISNWKSLENDEATSVYKVFHHAKCGQVAYGWASGAYYLYSGTKPCSKYFLAELIVGDSLLESTYRDSFANHPPRLVYYDPTQAGLDVKLFESRIFRWKSVLSQCYLEVTPKLFKSKSNIELINRMCILKVT
jgi:hypothetical protein